MKGLTDAAANSFMNNLSANSPLKRLGAAAAANRSIKWQIIKPWFAAHNIHKMETSFVVSVKYASHIKVFITATSKGEVKLWNNTTECECLGTLNSSNWDPSAIMNVVQNVRR